MRYSLIALRHAAFSAALLLCAVSCRSKHDGVDDEYSRGFFNCLSIVQHRYNLQKNDSIQLPYWNENKKSYLDNVDLYNYWDTSYMKRIK